MRHPRKGQLEAASPAVNGRRATQELVSFALALLLVVIAVTEHYTFTHPPFREGRRVQRLFLRSTAVDKNFGWKQSWLPPPPHTDLMYPELGEKYLGIIEKGDNWVAVYKPAGAVAHGYPNQQYGADATMVRRLTRTLQQSVHMVHRLDRTVSGVNLFALDGGTHQALHSALKGEGAQKVYYAVCANSGEELLGKGQIRVDRPLKAAEVEQGKRKMKDAVTLVEVLFSGRQPDCCLIRAQPLTGRWHQIRRHLKNMSLPVVGDDAYRGVVKRQWEACGLAIPNRTLLHLHEIRLPKTPKTDEISAACPFPPDVIELLSHTSWFAEAKAALPLLFAPPPQNKVLPKKASQVQGSKPGPWKRLRTWVARLFRFS